MALYDLNAARQSFPIAQQLTYLNHASISPVPLSTKAVMQAVDDRLTLDPMSFFAAKDGDPLGNIFVDFSTRIAQFINAASMLEVVGVTSTSTAMNLVAQSIDWQPGDNIVFAEVEFPSNAYPWMALERRGVECRMAPQATVEDFDRLVDTHTRLIAVSAIQFLSGHRADLVALGAYCHQRGILFAVDAIQAAGHIPLDVQAMHIDILAAGGQKSLMGPPGQGFLYVREAVCSAMQPTAIGPNAVEGWEHWLHYDLTPRQGAFRFMMGTTNISGMFGLMESIRFLSELGIAHIDAWTHHLSQIAIDDLAGRGYTVITPPDHYGPIVTFQVGDPADRKRAEQQATAMLGLLNENNIRVTKHWDAVGVPHLRISTHCYNTEEDVRRVGAVLEDYHE